MKSVVFLWPWRLDDRTRPSGGNRYDERLVDGLRALGWTSREYIVAGAWPSPAAPARDALARRLAALAPGTRVVIDGVMATAAAELIAAAAARLRIVVLLHMPFGEAEPGLAPAERQALAAAAGVMTTSAWTRGWVLDHYGLAPDRVRAVLPGTDPAALVPAGAAGMRLVCVANVSRLKGHDVLMQALAQLADLDWRCSCVGRPPEDAAFGAALHATLAAAGLESRVRWTGALAGAALEAAWHAADVLVLASRRESYGMVTGEALARGLPVIATRAGGIAEALGVARSGAVPGLLVAPGSADELAAALRSWLTDPALRARLRAVAAERRGHLTTWTETASRAAAALDAWTDGREHGWQRPSGLRKRLCDPYFHRFLAHGTTMGRRSVEDLSSRDRSPASKVSAADAPGRLPRAAWALAKLAAGVLVLAMVLRTVGAAPFLVGLRAIGPGTAAAAILITFVATLCCALRWRGVVRGFGADLALPHALAAYYRSQWLDAILPGGVLGDVYRALRRGSRIGVLARGVRSVFWERLLGQIAQLLGAACVLALLASPVRDAARLLLAGAGILLAVAYAMRGPIRRGWCGSDRLRALRGTLSALRGWTPLAWLVIAATSLLALAGYLAIFLLAARAVGVDWPLLRLAPVLLVALVASAIPFNVAGFGPREGVAAWMFVAAGGSAAQGVAASALYGMLGFVAVTPGLALLVLDWLAPAPGMPRAR